MRVRIEDGVQTKNGTVIDVEVWVEAMMSGDMVVAWLHQA